MTSRRSSRRKSSIRRRRVAASNKRKVASGPPASKAIRRVPPPSAVHKKSAEPLSQKSDPPTRNSESNRAALPPDSFSNVKEFCADVLNRGIDQLRREFADLKSYVPKDQMATAYATNAPKNRYRDVVCIDRSRVVLRDYEGGDYIHANWVDGGLCKFICTQAPLDNTVADFWHMIWQEEVGQILMLCELEENGRQKCADYWPTESKTCKSYGRISVSKMSDGYMNLSRNGRAITTQLEIAQSGLAPRTVTHVHWANWPDRGVPNDPRAVLKLMRNIQKSCCGQPVVVHCSAGIGRTGTVVMLDIVMKHSEHKQPIDVAKTMREVRDQRMSSVQTESQYLFVYRAMLEYAQARFSMRLPQAQLDKFINDYDSILPK